MSATLNNQNYCSEIQLIIGCSQTEIDTEQIKDLSSVLSQPLNWDYIINISTRNGVLPLVSSNLTRLFSDQLSVKIKTFLTKTFSSHVKHNMRLTSKMIEVVQLFKENGISVLPYKGPLLALQAYKNISLRKFGDLDILIKPDQLKQAVNLLTANNFTPVTDQYWLDNIKYCLIKKKDIGFLSNDESVYLELHWKLAKSYFDIPIKSEYLWQKSETITLAGSEIKTLSYNHLLIYLCLHGTKHAWERLSWISDINELVHSKKTVNWLRLLEEAKSLGCENVLTLGLFLAHDFFNLQTPLVSRIKEEEKLKFFQTIVDETRVRLFSEKTKFFELGENYAFQLKLKERFQDKCKLHKYYNSRFLRLTFSVSDVDKATFRLPIWLTPLYYILRPTRLIFNNLINFKEKK